MGLMVLFDEGCPLCVQAADWIAHEAPLVPIELVAAGSDQGEALARQIPWIGKELVVIRDGRDVWAGLAAFLTVLWALADYREWSLRLASPFLAPLSIRFFRAISANRSRLGAFFGKTACVPGECGHRGAPHAYRSLPERLRANR